jgi:hypothetical protein
MVMSDQQKPIEVLAHARQIALIAANEKLLQHWRAAYKTVTESQNEGLQADAELWLQVADVYEDEILRRMAGR